MRILIVDDEGSLLLTLVANLELEGFDVTAAENAAAALELIGERSFDLVLTDIRMPGMSGIELFRAIRKLRPDMPVILMTAFAAEHLVEEAIQEGVFAVLPKPFDIEHVIFALTRALSRPVVLLVDTADEARPIAKALSAVGLGSCITSDRKTALAAIKDSSADVVLIDIERPASGPELVEQILVVDPSVAVIATSTGSLPDLFRKVAELGAFACVPKPLEARRLVHLIARARARPLHCATPPRYPLNRLEG